MPKPRTTSTFAYTNTHPKGIVTHGDCVYRAISIATGKTWLEVYDELTALGRELLAPPNDTHVYGKYLDEIANRIDVRTVGGRLKGSGVAKLDKSKTYLVRMAHHLACVKDGKVRDTWDSSSKSAYIVWELR